jgi:sirohydrochlorin cobaltochelatase
MVMTTALILAGHGSHISPETAGVVWKAVDSLRAMRVADEITAGFWKEQPAFSRVLRTVTAEDITVVPLFTAQGFFTRQVIPAEMGLHNHPAIRYTRTIGEHSALSQIVQQRIHAAFQQTGFPPDETAIGIVGHGTKRSAESRTATQTQAKTVAALRLGAQVEAVFLDDMPSIPDLYTLTTTPNLIVVPYFLALGSHTTIDVPGVLGMPPGKTRAQINGRQVFYTDPVGVETSLTHMILELAHEAGTRLYPPSGGTTWDCFPTFGRDALIEAVYQQRDMTFGELRLTPDEVCVGGDDGAKVTLTDAAALRGFVRENPFRSLATSRDLPRGWRVPIDDPAMIHAVVETVYPGTVAEWAAARVTAFEEVIRRQVGAFRDLVGFEAQAEIVHQVCTGCVRHPTWFDGLRGELPCGEPCNHWLSAAKEYAQER